MPPFHRIFQSTPGISSGVVSSTGMKLEDRGTTGPNLYQWAWDASKETSQLVSAPPSADDVFAGQTNATVVGCTMTKERTRLKINPTATGHGDPAGLASTSSTGELFFDFRDGKSSSVSGPLNVEDTFKAKYMHGVFDFSEAGDAMTDVVAGLVADSEYLVGDSSGLVGGRLDFFWLRPDSQGEWAGSSAIRAFGPIEKTILVWDMTHPATNPAGYDDQVSGSDWGTSAFEGEEPFRLEFLTRMNILDSPFYLYGYVLSYKILTDIPLPIRIDFG